jgi:hypothetical protein
VETVDIIHMLEQMAEHGHAPKEGCNLFGVGYEEAFDRLKEKYLINRFARGGSGEKFVVGPFGSGKTHFLRQLLEIARSLGCVTSEVALNKDFDVTESLLTYREIVREVRPPSGSEHGMRGLLVAAVEQIRSMADDVSASQALVQAWIAGLDKADFKLETFGKVAKRSLQAYLAGDETTFESGCRWLGGYVGDRALCRELSVSPVPRSEEKLHGRRALLSLVQFIRHARFRGTVIGFDEAEQGFAVDKRKMDRILSMLQSGINAIVDLEGGSALIVYALTPDIVEEMEKFPALQQRVADPVVGRGFFDGETLAPKIDLTRRGDPVRELKAIGRRLVELLYDQADRPIAVAKDAALAEVDRVAEDVASKDIRSSNRRTMVKRTCSMLLRLYNEGVLADPGPPEATEIAEGEV